MTFLSHLYGLVLTLPATTTLAPLIVSLACFHRPLLNGCISVLNNTIYALKQIYLSCYHIAAALALYLWQACKLSLAVMLTPLQLYPFYNLYTMVYHVSSLVIIPFLQRIVSPTNIIQFFNHAHHLITDAITRLGRFLTTPFKLFLQFIRNTRHPTTTQLNEPNHAPDTSIEQNHTKTSVLPLEHEARTMQASLPTNAHTRGEQNQISTISQPGLTDPTHPHQASQRTSNVPTQDKAPSSAPIANTQPTPQPSPQPSALWLTRCIATSIHAISWTTDLIAATLIKLTLTVSSCLWFLLVQCPHYVGNAIFSRLSTLAWHVLSIPYRLLKTILTGCQSLGNVLAYLFCQALPNFTRSSVNYLRSYLLFQHALLAITIIQTRAINLSIQALYIHFGYSSFLITSSLILSCPFLILGLYKLNLNLISTIRQKVFHAQPLSYPSHLYTLIGNAILSTIVYCSIVAGNIITTLCRLCWALPNNLYQTRQDSHAQEPSLLNFYEDTVPENIRSSLADTLRSNFSVAHGRQPIWGTPSFLQNLPENFVLSAHNIAPITLLDQIQGKDATWPCTDDILSELNQPTKAALQSTQSLVCPITLDLIRHPIICSDGNTYEKKDLLNWLKQHNNVSPLTREPIVSLSPNRLYVETLQQAIKLLQSAQTPPNTHTNSKPIMPK